MKNLCFWLIYDNNGSALLMLCLLGKAPCLLNLIIENGLGLNNLILVPMCLAKVIDFTRLFSLFNPIIQSFFGVDSIRVHNHSA